MKKTTKIANLRIAATEILIVSFIFGNIYAKKSDEIIEKAL